MLQIAPVVSYLASYNSMSKTSGRGGGGGGEAGADSDATHLCPRPPKPLSNHSPSRKGDHFVP